MSDSFAPFKPFVFGGMSGMFATSCIQPIDMIKVQIQLQGEAGNKIQVQSKNPLVIGTHIVRTNGAKALYAGLSAGLVRQATYTTARMGLFGTFVEMARSPGEEKLAFWKRGLCGLTAGGLAAIVGTPADVALIRMQADTTAPPDQRRGYTNVFDALSKMAKSEGIASWWSGCQPTVYRAMCLNVGMLTVNAQAKDVFAGLYGMKNTDKVVLLSSSAVAGFFAAFLSLPADFVKTRLQRMQAGPDGKVPYKGFLDCAGKILKAEGPMAFYQGFPTYYVRIAPHAMITLLSMEMLNGWYKSRSAK